MTAAVCTIPATGSEASLSSAVPMRMAAYKESINLDLIRPVFFIINPGTDIQSAALSDWIAVLWI